MQPKDFSQVKQSGCLHQRGFLKILIANRDALKALLKRSDQFAFARLVEMINIRGAGTAATAVRYRQNRPPIVSEAPLNAFYPRSKIAQVLEHFQADDARETVRLKGQCPGITPHDGICAAEALGNPKKRVRVELKA